ncbi:MAG: hypothetical protein ACLQNG_01640 [Acidimicrobiales bacterium]
MVEPDATECPHAPPTGVELVVDELPFAAGFPPAQAEATAATATTVARAAARAARSPAGRLPAAGR